MRKIVVTLAALLVTLIAVGPAGATSSVTRSYVTTGVEGASASACNNDTAPSVGSVCVILHGQGQTVDVAINDTVATLPGAYVWITDGLGQPVGAPALVCGSLSGLAVPASGATLRIFFDGAAAKDCSADQAVTGTVTLTFH